MAVHHCTCNNNSLYDQTYEKAFGIFWVYSLNQERVKGNGLLEARGEFLLLAP